MTPVRVSKRPWKSTGNTWSNYFAISGTAASEQGDSHIPSPHWCRRPKPLSSPCCKSAGQQVSPRLQTSYLKVPHEASNVSECECEQFAICSEIVSVFHVPPSSFLYVSQNGLDDVDGRCSKEHEISPPRNTTTTTTTMR